MAQKIEIADFSGGITDYYLYAPVNKMKQCDNMLINQYPDMGKPFTRPGSELYDSLNPRIGSATRINTCFLYKGLLHVQSSTNLYYYGVLEVTAGSFVVGKTYTITFVGTTDFTLIGAANNNIGTTFVASGIGVGTGKAKKNDWIEVLGPTGNKAFPGIDTTANFSYSNWNYHTLITHDKFGYPKKSIINESGVAEIMEAGLPELSKTGITATPATVGATVTYLYKLVYRQDYKVYGPVQFTDIGTPCLSIEVEAGAAIDGTAGKKIALANIPSITNGTTSNFRTADIKIDIYRTVNNGTTFYKCGTINNGVTTFDDLMTDATLDLQELLYTTGGVVENDRPPKCKIVHVKNDTAYYANIETNGATPERLNFRMQQSIVGDIDSCPASFYVDVDDEIVSVSSTKSNVVILCKNSIYRVDGFYDETGRGGMLAERISDTAGCISQQSPVQALDGVFWMGLDAVYYTDGFRVIKLNQDYDVTYKSYMSTANSIDEVKIKKYQGKYDRKRNRIWWTVQQEDSTDIDLCYVLDLNWGVKENATFTTVSGESFAPSAIEFQDGNLIRCDKRGYILVHKANLYSDPHIDELVDPTEWYREAIIYNLESIAFDFGTSATRKYVTQANITAESTTNLSLQIVSNNDDNRKISALLPIRYRGNIVWGDPDVYWGDPQLYWNKQGLVHEKRRMPATNLRCNFKSIKFTNAKVAIISSDLIGTANINSTLKTVTLSDVVRYDWPSFAVGYFIAFEQDNYTTEYEVIGRTADVLTYVDVLNKTSTLNNQKWILRGYPKGEVLNLLNMSLIYEISGPTLNPYRTSDSGEVGTT
jgi:hypothetical protein